MDIKVNLEGEVFSTLRNEDGSIAKEEYFHNTIMNQSVNLLAKNMCFKNKLPYSSLRFVNQDSVNYYDVGSVRKQILYPDGMLTNYYNDGEQPFIYHDNISDQIYNNSSTYPWYTSICLRNPTLIKHVTIKFNGSAISATGYCTPRDYSIQTSSDTVDGFDGTWNTVLNFIGDTWYPISGLRTPYITYCKTFTIPTPIHVKGIRIVVNSRNTVDYLGNNFAQTGMLFSNMYINEGDFGLRRIKVGTNDSAGGTPDGTTTLTDLNNPVSLNSGYAFGYTSGIIDMEKDIYFESPNIIKMRYKWVNTTGAPVTVKEVGAFDYNNGSPTLVSRVLRDTTVNHLQYLDDVYKIRVNVQH